VFALKGFFFPVQNFLRFERKVKEVERYGQVLARTRKPAKENFDEALETE
jgi:preprotein translocase subunit Sss1